MLSHLSQRQEEEQEQQQEFLAHEIHDGACQYTAAAQMMFDTFRREHTNTLSGDWSSFDMGLEFLNHANEELRRLVRGLRPIQLAAGDLPTAIDRLIKEIETAGGLDIEFCHDIQANQFLHGWNWRRSASCKNRLPMPVVTARARACWWA